MVMALLAMSLIELQAHLDLDLDLDEAKQGKPRRTERSSKYGGMGMIKAALKL